MDKLQHVDQSYWLWTSIPANSETIKNLKICRAMKKYNYKKEHNNEYILLTLMIFMLHHAANETYIIIYIIYYSTVSVYAAAGITCLIHVNTNSTSIAQ